MPPRNSVFAALLLVMCPALSAQLASGEQKRPGVPASDHPQCLWYIKGSEPSRFELVRLDIGSKESRTVLGPGEEFIPHEISVSADGQRLLYLLPPQTEPEPDSVSATDEAEEPVLPEEVQGKFVMLDLTTGQRTTFEAEGTLPLWYKGSDQFLFSRPVDAGKNAVYAYDLKKKRAGKVFETKGIPVSVSHSGVVLLQTSEGKTKELYTWDPSTQKERLVLRCQAEWDFLAAISPDGKTAFGEICGDVPEFALPRPTQIKAVSLEDDAVQTITLGLVPHGFLAAGEASWLDDDTLVFWSVLMGDFVGELAVSALGVLSGVGEGKAEDVLGKLEHSIYTYSLSTRKVEKLVSGKGESLVSPVLVR